MRMTLRAPSPKQILAEFAAGRKRMERSVTMGVKDAGKGLQGDLRGQVQSSGLGGRLSKAVRLEVYPKREDSLGARAMVYPSGGSSKAAGKVLDAFDKGALIRGKDGLWLAIPVGNAKKMRGPNNKRITPGGWEQKTGKRLRFVYRAGRSPLLVDDGQRLSRRPGDPMSFRSSQRSSKARRTVPVFILVPQVKLRKRLDVERAARRWSAAGPAFIRQHWARRVR